ncbi:MAG: FAD-dependent oxidoreductase [Oscillospiraceae bacterium]|nr:FAD-dependent oxidoreductase [Oscillospiraceae bacterium]
MIDTRQSEKGVARRVDPQFKHKLESSPGGETLKYCYQCGTCTSACPIAKLVGVYRPNRILELAKLGVRDFAESSAFLFCSACTQCTKGCPQGVKVHEVMQSLKDIAPGDANVGAFLKEKFDGVLESLGEAIPFPVAYSWICLRPDEGESGKLILDAFNRSLRQTVRANAPKDDRRVAVIGSGPAGLTAAWTLVRAGRKVTVFESRGELGGMLRSGIPEYRLPKDVVDAEIDKIKKLGVEMLVNTKVDKAFFDGLLTEYAAVFVASGATQSRRLRLDGEDLPGVIPALEFLREYNNTGKADSVAGKKVVVIGGGNVATDAAGAAIRCGAVSVKLFCLEDRKSMPAHEWEIDEAAADGVEMNPSWGPKAIQRDGDKVTGVEFAFCSSVFDENKRFNPVFDESKTQVALADIVITAIGQAPDLSFLNEGVDTFRGAALVDPYTMETSLPGVFAGGDAIAGTSLVQAIETGKTAAESILGYLKGGD